MEEQMRRIQFAFVAVVFFLASASGFADAPADGPLAASLDSAESPDALTHAPTATPSDAGDELAWDQFDDPEFDPKAAPPSLLDTALEGEALEPVETALEPVKMALERVEANVAEVSRGIVLGPKGIDDQGRAGRLHTVSPGDTLWDLSAAYLGTPWVWPSVWIDNGDIENPHLIMPGDRIWITANEMRVISDAEAQSFLVPVVPAPEVVEIDTAPIVEAVEEVAMDASIPVEDPIQPLAALEADAPSTLEAFPVSVLGQQSESMAQGRQITISRRDAMGFVSEDALAGASSIVDSSVERNFLAAGDPVVLGMGEGDVEVGDQFAIFQVVEEVRDIETNRILGHHVEVLGWLEVKELTGDTSIGEIRMSFAMMRRGDRVMLRPMLSRHVTLRTTPDAIEGKIVFLPSERALMGDGGYVYLNRGEFHGVEVGSELEVFETGRIVNERSRRTDVRTPDHSVATLVVVSVTPDTSVAFVLDSSRELEVGDDVRPWITRLARR